MLFSPGGTHERIDDDLQHRHANADDEQGRNDDAIGRKQGERGRSHSTTAKAISMERFMPMVSIMTPDGMEAMP